MHARLQRKALLEKSYFLPNSGRTAMFDFYGLYAIWYDIGAGKAAYNKGTVPAGSSVAPAKREEVVSNALFSCAVQLSRKLGLYGLEAVADELVNLGDDSLIPPGAYVEWAQNSGNEKLRGLVHGQGESAQVVIPENVIGELGFDNVLKLLRAPFWKKYADMYCGERWAKIAEQSKNLVRLSKHAVPGDILELINAIDAFYDLEHNTASLASKLGDFSVTKRDLDTRAAIKSTRQFAKYCSEPVANMIKSAASYAYSAGDEDLRKKIIVSLSAETYYKYWTYKEDGFFYPKVPSSIINVGRKGKKASIKLQHSPLKATSKYYPMHSNWHAVLSDDYVIIDGKSYPAQFFVIVGGYSEHVLRKTLRALCS